MTGIGIMRGIVTMIEIGTMREIMTEIVEEAEIETETETGTDIA